MPIDDDDLIIPSENLPAEGFTTGNAHRKVLEAQGKFPRRIQITERKHGYLRRELSEYRRKKIAERDAAAAGAGAA